MGWGEVHGGVGAAREGSSWNGPGPTTPSVFAEYVAPSRSAYVEAADLIEGIGAALRHTRIARGMAQGDAAADLDVSDTQLCRWETGSVKPSLEMTVRILRWCGDENARSFR